MASIDDVQPEFAVMVILCIVLNAIIINYAILIAFKLCENPSASPSI